MGNLWKGNKVKAKIPGRGVVRAGEGIMSAGHHF